MCDQNQGCINCGPKLTCLPGENVCGACHAAENGYEEIGDGTELCFDCAKPIGEMEPPWCEECSRKIWDENWQKMHKKNGTCMRCERPTKNNDCEMCPSCTRILNRAMS